VYLCICVSVYWEQITHAEFLCFGSHSAQLQGKSLGAVVMGDSWVDSHGGGKAQTLRARTAPLKALKEAGRALRGAGAGAGEGAGAGTGTGAGAGTGAGTGAYDPENPFYVSAGMWDSLPPPAPLHRTEGGVSRTHDHTHDHAHDHRRLEYDNSTKIQVTLPQGFALSQAWRCSWKDSIIKESENPGDRPKEGSWFDCDVSYTGSEQVSLMGYSVRSKDFRYTAYLHFDRLLQIPIWELPPYTEELYDHRADTAADLGHRELVNMAKRPGMEQLTSSMRISLISYLRHRVVYKSNIDKEKKK
jgi:hypothetical protein